MSDRKARIILFIICVWAMVFNIGIAVSGWYFGSENLIFIGSFFGVIFLSYAFGMWRWRKENGGF